MNEPTYRLGLVVEGPADDRTVRALVDRCLHEGIEWLEPEMLDDIRGWRGIEAEQPYTKWTHAAALAREHRIQALGRFDGEPGKPYSSRAYKTLRLFAKLGMPDAVVMVVDADDQPQRREGLEQARGRSPEHAHVAIGIAEPNREAWVLAGFVPDGEEEIARLAEERTRLGFDPSHAPHELGRGKRDAKKVLASVMGEDHHREQRCVSEPALRRLREIGGGCGLTAFLDEVDARIVPVVAGRGASGSS